MIKKTLSLALFALLSTAVASADGVVNMPDNYDFNGDVFIDELTPSSPVCTDVNNKLTSSGCGGGGGAVTSVTSTDPNGNLTASPTTGAVVLNYSNSPTYTGQITSNNVTPGPVYRWKQGTDSGNAYMSADNTSTIETIHNQDFGLYTNTGDNIMVMDAPGNMAILNNLYVGGLDSFSGHCVRIGSHGELLDSGNPCPSGGTTVSSVTSTTPSSLTASPTSGAVSIAIPDNPLFTGNIQTGTGGVVASGTVQGGFLGALNFVGASGQCLMADIADHVVPTGSMCGVLHGNQSITATSGTCVAGTPVVFSPAFSAAPDISGSTSPVVGDTFAPSAITSTGFTPELCSVSSSAAATIYWQAAN